jgi:hypothetical protein
VKGALGKVDFGLFLVEAAPARSAVAAAVKTAEEVPGATLPMLWVALLQIPAKSRRIHG